jgi:hypothetical protein
MFGRPGRFEVAHGFINGPIDQGNNSAASLLFEQTVDESHHDLITFIRVDGVVAVFNHEISGLPIVRCFIVVLRAGIALPDPQFCDEPGIIVPIPGIVKSDYLAAWCMSIEKNDGWDFPCSCILNAEDKIYFMCTMDVLQPHVIGVSCTISLTSKSR